MVLILVKSRLIKLFSKTNSWRLDCGDIYDVYVDSDNWCGTKPCKSSFTWVEIRNRSRKMEQGYSLLQNWSFTMKVARRNKRIQLETVNQTDSRKTYSCPISKWLFYAKWTLTRSRKNDFILPYKTEIVRWEGRWERSYTNRCQLRGNSESKSFHLWVLSLQHLASFSTNWNISKRTFEASWIFLKEVKCLRIKEIKYTVTWFPKYVCYSRNSHRDSSPSKSKIWRRRW